jgi:hypothetical protein
MAHSFQGLITFPEIRSKLMRKFLLFAIFLVFTPLIFAQQSFNNAAIIKLTTSGLSEDLIITTINSSPGTYDTSADGLIALKTAGVSDRIITVILTKANAPVAPAVQPQQTLAIPTVPQTVSVDTPNSDSTEPGTAKGSKPIHAGSRIVIAPMGGFETYFAAAVREKKVPITLTLDKTSAEFYVVSTDTEWQGFVYGSGGTANFSHGTGSASYGSSASSTRGLEASIMLIDAHSKDIVWAYEVHKSSHGSLFFGTLGARGKQSIAEACAKHLKEYIEKGK